MVRKAKGICSLKILEKIKDGMMSVTISSYPGKGFKLHQEAFMLGIRIDYIVREVIDRIF